jgi:hypothetical protein
MTRGAWLLILGFSSIAIASPAAPAGAPVKAPAGAPAKVPASAPRFEAVTFVVRHRVFHDFRDFHRVKLNQDFILGDTDYIGRVVQFVPDFEMRLPARKVISRSPQPNNPAFKVLVRKNKAPQDTTWAFLNSPPHFARNSYFAFQVVQIDFVGRPPIVADTTDVTKRPAMPGMHPKATPASKDSASTP